MTKLTLFFALFTTLFASAQDTPEPTPASPPAAEATAATDDGVRVSILGYHDLGENLPETAMRIHTSKFRTQMDTIRQRGIKVISMSDFTAWKKGDTMLPDKSILITFDDGWKSVYTDAYPILKELNFPFTVFLYKNYVDGGGRALTTPMLEEMLASGLMTIGSHSVSHPYPLTVKSFRKKGPDAFDAYLRKEMGESKWFLDAKFPKSKITTYAFPGGFYTEEMLKMGDEFKYDFMFTVVPGKVKKSLPNQTLPRNIILGNYDKVFEIATTFRESSGNTSDLGGATPGIVQQTPYPVQPLPGSIINSRLPEISADLSTVPNLDPKSLVMRIAGFGEVPAIFSPESLKFYWQINRRLRQPNCQVSVTWKDTTGKAPETPLRWSFQIDRESAYLPEGD